MFITIRKNLLRNILEYCVEKRDKNTPYFKECMDIMNSASPNIKDCDVEVSEEFVNKIYKDIEYNACWDKLGRYGNFYYELKRITNKY